MITNGVYLEDSRYEVDGQILYGSPWQPRFMDLAFNLQRGPEIREKWELIPADVNILITHGPPMGICDRSFRGDHAGCADLLAVVQRIAPIVHIFGHIHEGGGVQVNGSTTYINGSSCGFPNYLPMRSPIVLEL